MRYLRNIFVGKRFFDVAVSRRFRMRIVTGILIFVTLGGSFYGFSRVTKADAINPTDFVTTWKTDNTGISSPTSITIPTDTMLIYDYSVDWNNDGIVDETNISGDITHDFGTAGTYKVRISGVFPSILFQGAGDAQKILEVNQWGTIQWESMQNAFMGASNLVVSATDSPNLALVTDMSGMFYEATSMNQNLNGWDTGNIRQMTNTFAYASAFNQPLGNWDTSNVIDMSGMFYYASVFNQNIGTWNTGSVLDMSAMFSGADSFNNGGSANIDSWSMGNVTNMSQMFQHAIAFNQPIGGWNTSSVTNLVGMFQSAAAFNQPIGGWNTSNVLNMNSLFYLATNFNQNISIWDTSNVTTMGDMFSQANAFDQPLNTWNTAHVTNMRSMFYGASAFNQPLNTWNTANVTDMSYMFLVAPNFNQNIDSWNTGSVTDMSFMFSNASMFNQPLSNWDTSNVMNMSYMFSYASAFDRPLNTWDTAHVTNMRSMFSVAQNFNQLLDSWDTSGVTTMNRMFYGAYAFNQPLNTWDTANVTDMALIFSNATSFNQPLTSWNTSNVTNMGSMFNSATNFDQSLASWDITGITQFTSWDSSLADMLSSSALSQSNYEATLIEWSSQTVQSGVHLGAIGRYYCTAQAARQTLIDNHSWVITGDTSVCTAPSAPQNLQVTPSQDTMMLNWDAPTSNGTGNFTGYTVQYKLSSSATWTSLPDTTGLSTTILSLILGTSYDFQVLAVSSHGTSAPSNIITATTASSATRVFDFATLGSSNDDVVSKAVLSVESSDCYGIDMPSLSVLGPSDITAPEANVRILGGLGYSLTCTSSGGSAIVTITLGTHFSDVSKLRLYKKSGSAILQDITNQVAISNHTNGASSITTIDYTLIDGGAFDEDGIVNGVIVDPVYVGVIGEANGNTTLANTGENLIASVGFSIVLIMSSAVILSFGRSLRP